MTRSPVRHFLAACIVGITPWVCSQGTTESRPGTRPSGSLAFATSQHDFGRVRDDRPLDWRFGFKNEGSAPVTITDIHSSCGCTTTNLQKKTYEPGAAGEIVATFNPANRQGKERKTITVKTDEPGAKAVELVLLVEVIPRIGVDPPALWLGEVRFDNVAAANVRKQITITSRVSDFAIKTAAIDDPRFVLTALAPELAEADGDQVTKYVYEVALPENIPIGRIQASLRIDTNDTMKAQIVIPVIIEGFSELRIAPSPIALQMVAPGVPAEGVVAVTARGGKPFRVLEAKVEGSDKMELKTLIEPAPGSNGSAWRVHVQGTAPAEGTLVKGTLKIKTDVAAQSEVEVPITGYVLRASQQH